MNLKRLYIYSILFITISLIISCNKDDDPSFETSATDYFWLRNDGADMAVVVDGNTASRTYILYLHGGPANGAIYINDYYSNITSDIEKDCAIIYWDQRYIGKSKGKVQEDKLNKEQYIEDLEKLVALIKHRYGNDINLFLMGHSWGGILGQYYLTMHPDEECVKGWIEIGSTHCVSEMKKFGKQRLIMIANEQIEKGKSVSVWEDYIQKANNYCDSCHNDYEDMKKYLELTVPAEDQIREDGELENGIEGSLSLFLYNFDALLNNEVYVEDKIIEDFSGFDLRGDLHKIKVPSLFLFGKYDIRAPIELAYQAKNLYGTPEEDFYIHEFLHSSHGPHACEPELFQETVRDFINHYKNL